MPTGRFASKGFQAGVRFAKARGASSWAKAYNANFSRSMASSVSLPRIVGEAPISGFPEQVRRAVAGVVGESSSVGGMCSGDVDESKVEDSIAGLISKTEKHSIGAGTKNKNRFIRPKSEQKSNNYESQQPLCLKDSDFWAASRVIFTCWAALYVYKDKELSLTADSPAVGSCDSSSKILGTGMSGEVVHAFYQFIDPQSVLFAEHIDAEWRYADDPTLKSPILERNNVGMGMLIANSKSIDLPMINSLYRRLRNLEVNTTKRLVCLTSSHRDNFAGDINLQDLLLLAQASQYRNEIPRYALEYFKNLFDLSLMVAEYHKPLVTLYNGEVTNAAAAWCGLSSEYSGAYHHSAVAGASFLLARLPFCIGNYLALTGEVVKGQDIVYCGLAKNWISPDAFRLLEVTSEKQLEVSESDGKALISEHFLDLPEGWSLAPYIGLIQKCFSQPHLFDVVESLVTHRDDPSLPDDVRDFASRTIDNIGRGSPLASHVTHQLINRARKHIERATNAVHYQFGATGTHGNAEKAAQVEKALSDPDLYQRYVIRPAMIEIMQEEWRVLLRFLMRPELVRGLYFKQMFDQHANSEGANDVEMPDWFEHEDVLAVRDSSWSSMFFKLPDTKSEYFAPAERSDLPLSAHPLLRVYHPDYDPKTGLDHDPRMMAREVERWSDNYLEDERYELMSEVTGIPVAKLRSRWSALCGGWGGIIGPRVVFGQLPYPPNDPYFSDQRALFKALHIQETWRAVRESGLSRRDVIVTVIDTGVATQQPDLVGKLLKGRDASGSSVPSVEDTQGHGTMVTSIIAGVINNGIGITGIADRVKIRPIRLVALPDGPAAVWQTERGWEIASESKDSEVIVFAFSTPFTPERSTMLKRVITKAVNQGSFVVVAASNNNTATGPSEIELPCSLANAMPGVLCVAATLTSDPTLLLSEASLLASFGVPGTEVISAILRHGGGQWQYKKNRGSSCATAIVGGIAALIQSIKKFKPDVIKEILLNATEGKVRTVKGVEMLYGVLRPDLAVKQAIELAKHH
ncbi:hypothetical protein FOL47_008107 [Perkinsus chesapeaki]|uniref:Peptidase S8/S53 domain-containing protein n=1 Tax=Perkinsus chesapeaki TaxID=330153 RepID=A0A7J6LGY5_PERCH|nr:hypothetical protein FOL47_008107 [Perkinsus chesapeaki]